MTEAQASSFQQYCGVHTRHRTLRALPPALSPFNAGQRCQPDICSVDVSLFGEAIDVDTSLLLQDFAWMLVHFNRSLDNLFLSANVCTNLCQKHYSVYSSKHLVTSVSVSWLP